MKSREEKIEELAQIATDNIDMSDLLAYFYEQQYTYYEGFSDADLDDIYNEQLENT